MRRFTTIIMALAVVLGMTQCRKPNMPQYGTYIGVTKDITFTTGGSSKVVVDNSILDELHFRWQDTDNLYVYGSANGTFTDGQYCGALDLAKGEGTENGFFSGTLENVPAAGGKLRFYYSATALGGTEKSIDLSSQDGTMTGLATKLVAWADVAVSATSDDYSATLEVPYAIVKLNLSSFGTTTVTMTGTTNKGLTVSAKGVKNVTAGTSTTLSGAAVATNTCYVAVMPESVTTLSFSGNSKVGKKDVTLSGNTFCTEIGGGSVAVEAKTPKANPSSVTTTAGCSGSIYSMGGTVTLETGAAQEVEYGFVCSETASIPTIEDTEHCFKVVGGTADMPVGTTSFTVDLTGLTVGTTYYVRAYAIGESGTAVYAPNSSAGIKTIVGGDAPKDVNWNGGGTPGASPKVFTVASGRTVRFSQGNLQYIGSSETPYWKFAEHQFDFLGNNGQGSTSETVDRDLFGWGTSGWNNGNYFYQPYNTSNSSSSPYTSGVGYGYGPTNGSSYTFNLTGDYANSDWGVYNAISNGGNAAGMWRTLTSAEWYYLFNTRTDASSKWGHGKVGSCTPGMIILPDDWSLPTGLSFTPGKSSWSNVYSYTDWSLMEAAGAVFLPAAGYRRGTSVSHVGSSGYYWSSSYNSSYYAYSLYFFSGYVYPQNLDSRYRGQSVRLVR